MPPSPWPKLSCNLCRRRAHHHHHVQNHVDTSLTRATPPYLSLLRLCIERSDSSQAKRIKTHIINHHGYLLNGLLGDYLVLTLAKCSAIDEALFTSYSIPSRSVFSWTSIITSLVDSGYGYEALRMYECMQQDGILPDAFTFVSLFKACGMVMDIKCGKKFHIMSLYEGFVCDLFVVSAMVNMYGKCGDLEQAEIAFGSISYHNVISWSAMLSAYVDRAEGIKALLLYRQMSEQGVKSDHLTFMLAIQACTIIVESDECLKEIALEIGYALHSEAVRKSLMFDPFLGNTLVNMYGRCGSSIAEAEHVFNTLLHNDIVSWNAMLLAYVEQGEGQKALQLYMHIQENGMSPDKLTTIFGLQACSTITMEREESELFVAQEIGKSLHIDSCKKGFEIDDFLGCSLVKMYGKTNAITEAESVFGALSHHDVASWNTMLSVYVELMQSQDLSLTLCFGHRALCLYRQMERDCTGLDPLTYVLALQACTILVLEDGFIEGQSINILALEIGRALHSDARRKGFSYHAFVGNILISFYGRHGSIGEAEDVFLSLLQRDGSSWTSILSLYVEQGLAERGLQLYTRMIKDGVRADGWTFVVLFQACGAISRKEQSSVLIDTSSLEIGSSLHLVADAKGFTSDSYVGSTILSMYGKCGAIVEAEHVFSDLSEPTNVSWTAMLSAYVEQGHANKALDTYRAMVKQSICLNTVTLNCVLQACGAIGSLETCKEIHFHLVSLGCEHISMVTATLIHAYGNCTSMVDGQDFFEKLFEPDIVSWNACISGHIAEGSFLKSIDIFEKLKIVGVQPDEVTFTVILSACSHIGLVSRGMEYFNSMSNEYGLMPNIKHYCSMVDLLGRVGDLEGLRTLLERMPIQADLHVWMCTLGSCCTHGNLELAKYAFDHATSVQEPSEVVHML